MEIEAQAAILATGGNSPLSQNWFHKIALRAFFVGGRGYYRNIAKPENQKSNPSIYFSPTVSLFFVPCSFTKQFSYCRSVHFKTVLPNIGQVLKACC
ncbi:MAG: hypothetical protein IPH16_17105 [Haliscomenobacter sp.]|nr:hypothetical protein [Haliscomenobacter sp.]